MKDKILVSACLAGVKCRYDGKGVPTDLIKKLTNEGRAVLVCPEQLGGLPTPRTPAEIIENKVIDKNGIDLTSNFTLGAQEAYNIGCMNGCSKKAILKSNSPSCGYGKIYDGTYSGTLKEGNGIFAKLLKENGFEIRTEKNLDKDFLK